jgi:hypothetical protein
MAYPVTVAIVEGFKFNNVWMSDDAHDLQFSILVQVSFCPPKNMDESG